MDRDPLDKIFFRSSARMIRDNNIHTGPAGGAHNPKETFTALRFGILSIQVRDHFQGYHGPPRQRTQTGRFDRSIIFTQYPQILHHRHPRSARLFR